MTLMRLFSIIAVIAAVLAPKIAVSQNTYDIYPTELELTQSELAQAEYEQARHRAAAAQAELWRLRYNRPAYRPPVYQPQYSVMQVAGAMPQYEYEYAPELPYFAGDAPMALPQRQISQAAVLARRTEQQRTEQQRTEQQRLDPPQPPLYRAPTAAPDSEDLTNVAPAIEKSLPLQKRASDKEKDLKALNELYGGSESCQSDTNCDPVFDNGNLLREAIPQDGSVKRWLLDNTTGFGGTRIFNDDINLRHRGSFAAHSGFNWSAPFIIPLRLSGQFGLRAVQSNLNNDSLVPDNFFSEPLTRIPYETNSRSQIFLTAGLFKRFATHPIQFGAAYDYCFDDTYQSFRYGQIRAEVSAWTQKGLEFGARTAFQAGKQDVQFHTVDFFTDEDFLEEYTLETKGYYYVYAKKYHDIGANAMLYFGASYKGALLCGFDYEVPLSNRFTLQSGFSAMFDEEVEAVTGSKRENWDAHFTITFYPSGRGFNDFRNPLRAMFNVADNGSMRPNFNLINRRLVTAP